MEERANTPHWRGGRSLNLNPGALRAPDLLTVALVSNRGSAKNVHGHVAKVTKMGPFQRLPATSACPSGPNRQCCPPLLLRLELLQVYPFTPTPPAVHGPAAGLSPDGAPALTCMAEAAAEAG